MDQLLSSGLDRQKTIAMLKSKHSHQNLMQLQKETKIMQHDMKQSHFSNQVKHQHKSVKWLGYFSKGLYAVIFVASNIMLFWHPDLKNERTLYILLIVHLVFGYVLLLVIGLIVLTTAIASPFLLTAFLYKKYNTLLKRRHTQVHILSNPLRK